MYCLRRTGLRERRSGVFAAGVCLWAMLTSGADLCAQETIDFPWAMQQTLQQHPRLQAFPFLFRQADAKLLQAEKRPLPTLSLMLENAAGQGDYSGTDAAEFSLTLGQTLEMGGKRQRRQQVAQSQAAVQQAEYAVARLDVLAETGRQYYQVLRLQALSYWIESRIDQEQQALGVIEDRARAGAVATVDVAKMRLLLSQSRALQAQLSGEYQQAKLRLSSMWLAQPEFDRVTGDLARVPDLPDAAQLQRALAQTPLVLRQQGLQRLAEGRLVLANAKGRVDVDISLGVKRFQRSQDHALLFNVKVPLPLSQPNEGNITAANEALAVTQLQSQLMQRELALQLESLRLSLSTRYEQERRIREELIPNARQLLVETQKGYERGRYSVLQWADAQAEVFALEKRLIETQANIFLQFLELERLTGQSMVSGPAGDLS